MTKMKYICHAVIKGILVEDSFVAVSTKQAWYFFAKKHGFSMYDFKVIGMTPVFEQMKMQFN